MLAPRDTAELRACIVNALASGAGAAKEAEDVARCFSAVRALVDEVCSEFGSAWNARPAIQQLPVELLCSVLHSLDLAHRVRATDVCRAWRAAGLQDRTLWSDISVGNRSAARFAAMSPVLLQRSDPVPFRLAWPRTFESYYSPRVSTETWAEYTSNLSRMAGFDGPLKYASMIGLLDHAAPALEEFSVSDRATAVILVPPSWGGAGTPRLRSMHLPGFYFPPESEHFEALRSFSGSLTRGGDEAARLFELCPNLEELVLQHVMPSSILPSTPLPRSLKSVTLSAAFSISEQDPTSLLAQWMQDPPRCLTLQFVASLAPVLRMFKRAYPSGEWSMFVSPVLYLSSPAGHEYGTNLGTAGVAETPFRGISPLLDRLGDLTVDAAFLPDVCNAQLALPRLRALRVFLHNTAGAAGWAGIAGPLRAPALRDLDLVWLPRQAGERAQQGAVLDVIFGRVPRELRAWVAYDAPLLACVRVILTLEATETPSNEALAALAREVEIHFD